jgi:DNA repair protein RadC
MSTAELFDTTSTPETVTGHRVNSMKIADLVNYVRERTTDQPVSQDTNTVAALAVILGPDTAQRLYARAMHEQHQDRPSLADLLNDLRTAPDSFVDLLSTSQIARLLAAADLARALNREHNVTKTAARVTNAEEAIDYVLNELDQLQDAQQEYFYAVLLDIRNKVIKPVEIARGSVSAAVVDPADILREACIHHASRVILVHNHPSGETDPSKEDIDTTSKIVQALKYVGVRVLDHVIVGRVRQDFYSFARSGLV